VADNTPPELRRLVEFLNEKMDDVEVLAVEIKQFVGVGIQRVMVPRLIGMTETAREKKPVSVTKTSRLAFLQSCSPEAVPVFERFIGLVEECGYLVAWGQKGFSIRPMIGGALTSVGYGWPSSVPPTRIEFYSGYLTKLAPEVLQAACDEVRSLGIFTRSGEHTYRAEITQTTAQRVKDALQSLFTIIERFVESGSGRGLSSGANAA